MKESVAMAWADALESGKYEQGEDVLRATDDKFCCLGVLCDISGLVDWVMNDEASYYETSNGSYGMLPENVERWAGMKSYSGDLDGRGSLWRMNDTDGLTFSEIAQVIRKEWRYL